jgi:hypothetical protein|tara:strand:+ start:2937 stop:3302 length:366 start_codon:yes stop_codon:yes gene_type:complete
MRTVTIQAEVDIDQLQTLAGMLNSFSVINKQRPMQLKPSDLTGNSVRKPSRQLSNYAVGSVTKYRYPFGNCVPGEVCEYTLIKADGSRLVGKFATDKKTMNISADSEGNIQGKYRDLFIGV